MARKNGKDRGILEYPKDSGQWWVRIYINGREKRFKADNKTQAKALYGKIKADIREKRYFPEQYNQTEDITLRAWITRFLEVSTIKSKQNQIRYGKWWSKVLGKKLLKEIKVEDISRIQIKVLNKGKRDPQTVNRYLAFLKHVLNLAMKDALIDRNPVCSVKFSPEPRGRLRFLSDTEINTLKGHIDSESWKKVVLAIETGMRLSELFNTKWEHVDLDQGFITIPHDKAHRTRHVPLTEAAKETVRSLTSWMTSAHLFPSPRFEGHPMEGSAFVKKIFMPALAKAGIKGATWHTLRHTFASRLVMKGVDIRTVAELMGHSNLSTTVRYAHLSPAHLREAVNRGSLGNVATSDIRTVTNTVTDDKAAFNVLRTEIPEVIETNMKELVRLVGIEPTANSLEGYCSIH